MYLKTKLIKLLKYCMINNNKITKVLVKYYSFYYK